MVVAVTTGQKLSKKKKTMDPSSEDSSDFLTSASDISFETVTAHIHEDLQFFCETCGVPVCSKCLTSKFHDHHNIAPLENTKGLALDEEVRIEQTYLSAINIQANIMIKSVLDWKKRASADVSASLQQKKADSQLSGSGNGDSKAEHQEMRLIVVKSQVEAACKAIAKVEKSLNFELKL